MKQWANLSIAQASRLYVVLHLQNVCSIVFELQKVSADMAVRTQAS